MKCVDVAGPIFRTQSCPARGTWVEIVELLRAAINVKQSCPARGTWVEMPVSTDYINPLDVVPRTGHVG